MSRILILADTPGWIVDRITDEMIRLMPFEFTKRYYDQISTDELISLANTHDLVHYQNWDWHKHLDRIGEIKTPILTSIRSFRFPEYALKIPTHIHILNPGLSEFFPNATYIPDGIFDCFQPDHEFTVGFAGRPDEYKGFPIISQACKELGARFNPALNVAPDKMPEYYRSVDLMVIASENEGANTIALECMAMNKPFITTNVGMAKYLNVNIAERSVNAMCTAIGKFYTRPQVADYNWENICKKFTDLYGSIIEASKE